jgi:hypothetical protein
MVKKNLKGYFFVCTTVLMPFLAQTTATAKEGMWMPPLLKVQETDMKEQGLQIPVEKIYNEQGTGLNNAIVLFGKGCTGEVISPKGLVLTNHHCGYGTVQGLSSTVNDYFANGFWAKNQNEELPCPGLTVTFIRKMENVTWNILSELPDTMDEKSRQAIIAVRIKALEKGYKHTTGLDASIKPYYYGNQYWITLSETYRDIRLVGFPPNGIGSFGGDTDNWSWPRHTGDFSMFRIYAGKDNKPADYSKDNIAYKAPQFFTINAGGYKEGDFSMVYGFPAYTSEYITSYQLNHITSYLDPIRIEARTKRLDVWTKNMSADRDVFIKYTSKRAGIANGWKKWQGELRGLKLNNVLSKKQAYEGKFQGWASRDNELPYTDDLLAEIGARSIAVNDAIQTEEYLKEGVLGVELLAQNAVLERMLQLYRQNYSQEKLRDTLSKLVKSTDGFYKNYDATTDKEVFVALMPMIFEKCPGCIAPALGKQYAEQGKDYERWASYVFRSALAVSQEKLKELANNANPADSALIMNDPSWQLYESVTTLRKAKILPAVSQYNERMAYMNRLYMKGQMQYDNDKAFFPDANFTLRLTYGKIKGIDPDGPAGYSFQTNLDEAIAKDNPAVDEFRVPMKLKELHAAKDYGKWAVNGTVPIAFIAVNHTSGGNSGSPVLNAKGELIGTNFDRIWEGTMSDLYFDPNLSRNISLDVRYTLFIIEKLGGAGWLLKEMKIVQK